MPPLVQLEKNWERTVPRFQEKSKSIPMIRKALVPYTLIIVANFILHAKQNNCLERAAPNHLRKNAVYALSADFTV